MHKINSGKKIRRDVLEKGFTRLQILENQVIVKQAKVAFPPTIAGFLDGQ